MARRYIAAAKDGNVDILRDATRKDLNTQDEDGMTATIWAAHNGNLEALRLIVGREGEVNKFDYMGLTALHHASMRGHLDVVSYLVHWGCNIYALDNDMHSAQDLASINNHEDIIRFLDKVLDQKRYKNPKSAAKQREEAIKVAEINQKKYEKLKEVAARKAEKEQKKFEKEINGNTHTKQKKNIFQTLTMRMKGGNSSNQKPSSSGGGLSNFSDMAGLTYSRNPKGAAKKNQMRRASDHSTLYSNRSDFKTSIMDDEGNRTLKSIGKSQGYHGTVSEVMYVNTAKRGVEDDMAVTRRPLASDMFHNNRQNNIYRARSENDLLDSGVDSYNGEEDEEEENNTSSLFHRKEFGKLSFLPKNPMLGTLQSFDDEGPGFNRNPEMIISDDDDDDNDEGDNNRRNNDNNTNIMKNNNKTMMTSYSGNGNGHALSSTNLPWNVDDLDALDENDDNNLPQSELTALEMFLYTNGLTNHLHVFSREEIDLQLLMKMTDSELKDLGLPLGPRKKLSDAIHKRKAILQSPPKMIDSYL